MTEPAGEETLLDAALLRQQRLALSLSERDVAKRLGVSEQVIAGLERGQNHDELTAGLVCALADVLALPVAAVLRQGPAGGAGDAPVEVVETASTVTADARTVGALLAAEPTLVPVLTLAQVLEWEPERTLAALEALEPLLDTVGRRLHRLAGDVKVVADATVVPTETLTALSRRSFARRGMSLSQARLLRRAWLGELTGNEHGNADRVAIGELINAGLLEAPAGDARGERPALSPDVAFSLTGPRASPEPA